MDLSVGLKHTIRITVKKEHTANEVHTGGVDTFSTPSMLALMESAAYFAIQNFLPRGQSSVGVFVNISHLAPTPIGMVVTVNAELKEVNGRRLTFAVEAFDEKEKIGEGTHQRFLIDRSKFLEKAKKKQIARKHMNSLERV